jgi:hypothetical protein
MKHGVISFSSAVLLTLLAAPLVAKADANPEFDDDAKPILRMQPGLLQYVESRFDVKDSGTAKYPGDDDRRPGPPFIFRARPAGSDGPYNLRLLIQPGGPGHILNVVDMTKVHLTAPGNPSSGPSVANQPPDRTPPPQAAPTSTPHASVQVPELSAGPVQQQPASAQQQPSAPQPTSPTSDTPSGPTADTPSGPIMDSGSQPPSSGQPGLAPPPDPAPAAQ